MQTDAVVSEHIRADRVALSLSVNIRDLLQPSVWLFAVAELFSCDHQTIHYFAILISYGYYIPNSKHLSSTSFAFTIGKELVTP
jgi:hypothetical protein